MFCVCAHAFNLPDTNQTKCYTAVEPWGETPCTGATGQDAEYIFFPLSYADNGNGTVTDNNTGLMWQKCTVGYTDVNACTGGGAVKYNWYQATGTVDINSNPVSQFKNVCADLNTSNFGGHADWRLPTKKELVTLVDYGRSNTLPTIDPIFTSTSLSYYWSSNAKTGTSSKAWYVDFIHGSWNHQTMSITAYVRCVRGAKVEPSLTINGGTVTDNNTGLMWQQGEPGAMTWEAALTYCNTLGLGDYHNWRLPNIKELESLTDDSLNQPTIDINFFPDALKAIYWSSTTNSMNPGVEYQAWCNNFTYGPSGTCAKINSGGVYVRCVRGGEYCANKKVKVGNDPPAYDYIQDAYGAATSPQTIRARDVTIVEDLDFAGSKIISLIGGYDCLFWLSEGFTTITGSMTIGGTGSITVSNLAIK
jgi:hypothetical protein